MAKTSAGRAVSRIPDTPGNGAPTRPGSKGRRSGSLELFLLGLLSVSVGFFFSLVFFGG